MNNPAVAQAADELSAACGRLYNAGLTFADARTDMVGAQIASVADQTITALTQHNNDQLASATCTDLMNCLWPHAAPEHVGMASWWRTPLGLLCAQAFADTDTEPVSHTLAADILGVTRGSISQWVHRSTLAKHPDGSVHRGSVLQRLAQRGDQTASTS